MSGVVVVGWVFVVSTVSGVVRVIVVRAIVTVYDVVNAHATHALHASIGTVALGCVVMIMLVDGCWSRLVVIGVITSFATAAETAHLIGKEFITIPLTASSRAICIVLASVSPWISDFPICVLAALGPG